MRGRIGLAALLLAGACASTEAPRPARGGASVSDGTVKIGQPYTVNGTRYVPADDPYYDAIGQASRYGGESGTHTANGETYNVRGYSAAHTTLPLPSYVEVTALQSGRTIVVRVNDRGPFARGRLIDLSPPAAAALGIDGTATVRVRRVFPPEAERAALRGGQAGAPRLAASPQLLSALRARAAGGGTVRLAEGPMPDVRALEANPNTAVREPTPGVRDLPDEVGPPPPGAPPSPKPAKRVPAAISPRVAPAASSTPPAIAPAHGPSVQIGAFSDRARAQKQAAEVAGRVMPAGALYRVRVGPYASEAAAREALAKLRAQGYGSATIVRD